MKVMDKQTANDVIEAAERTGGKAHRYPLGKGWGTSIGNLPDVAAFIRALRALGVQGRVYYSAGSGWSVE